MGRGLQVARLFRFTRSQTISRFTSTAGSAGVGEVPKYDLVGICTLFCDENNSGKPKMFPINEVTTWKFQNKAAPDPIHFVNFYNVCRTAMKNVEKKHTSAT